MSMSRYRQQASQSPTDRRGGRSTVPLICPSTSDADQFSPRGAKGSRDARQWPDSNQHACIARSLAGRGALYVRPRVSGVTVAIPAPNPFGFLRSALPCVAARSSASGRQHRIAGRVRCHPVQSTVASAVGSTAHASTQRPAPRAARRTDHRRARSALTRAPPPRNDCGRSPDAGRRALLAPPHLCSLCNPLSRAQLGSAAEEQMGATRCNLKYIMACTVDNYNYAPAREVVSNSIHTI